MVYRFANCGFRAVCALLLGTIVMSMTIGNMSAIIANTNPDHTASKQIQGIVSCSPNSALICARAAAERTFQQVNGYLRSTRTDIILARRVRWAVRQHLDARGITMVRMEMGSGTIYTCRADGELFEERDITNGFCSATRFRSCTACSR